MLRRPSLRLSCALALLPVPVLAEVPTVVADTVPVHSLVAQVMGDLGTPALLLPPGVSVHDYQMRPSDGAVLADADVIIWTGPALAPFLAGPIDTLAPDARHLALLDSPGWTALPARGDAAFDDGHDHADDHGDTGADDHDHDHDHDHGATDPHAWLSPEVAAVWLDSIAILLSEQDPDNAATYAANAAAAGERLATLQTELAATLAPLAGRGFVVPHDAYQYFETAFGLPAAGAIALSDAAAPGPARIATLRDRVAAGDIACILTDPQTNPDWTAVLRETGIARTAQVDADGTDIAPGSDAHATILRNIAAALTDCLS